MLPGSWAAATGSQWLNGTVYTAGYSKRLQIPKEGKSNDHQYL